MLECRAGISYSGHRLKTLNELTVRPHDVGHAAANVVVIEEVLIY